MARNEEPRTADELTEEELEAQKAEALPNREAMSTLDGGFGGFRPMPIDPLPPVPANPNDDLTL